jgi:hypothetical protein
MILNVDDEKQNFGSTSTPRGMINVDSTLAPEKQDSLMARNLEPFSKFRTSIFAE